MTLFNFTLQRGAPIVEQLVFCAIRAIVRGEYRAEEAFPSVRAIASSLKIHPNTAHKAVQILIEERWLEARPGVGTVVAARPPAGDTDGRSLLREDVERLVLKAISNHLSLADLTDEIRKCWRSIGTGAKD